MYKLVRERDNKTLVGQAVKFIEWEEDGRFSQSYDEPGIGRSVILDPHHLRYTWLTTTITSFEYNGDILKFSTKNSDYVLYFNKVK
jgi:hypothetical protein